MAGYDFKGDREGRPSGLPLNGDGCNFPLLDESFDPSKTTLISFLNV